MRRATTSRALLLLLLTAAGCGPTVKVDGETYRALTQEDQKLLVRLARLSLERSPKAVSREELAVIQKNEPAMEIDYTGDKFGRALVSWQLPERKLSVVFEGEFTGSDRIIYLQNERNPVDFIDYSKGKPVVRKLKAPTTGSGVQTNTLQVRSPAQ